MFKAKHKFTNELAITTMVGGGLLATGFKGSSSDIFREATNQTANGSAIHTFLVVLYKILIKHIII